MTEQSIQVLLIEDDEDDYILTRARMEEMGDFRVALDWAGDRASAEGRIKGGAYDVILLDYHLGGSNGLEILEMVRAHSDAPVIMLTGSEEHELDVAATKAGAYDYLVKRHINTALLERSIRYAVERHRVETAWRGAVSENNRLAEAINNLTTGVVVCDPDQNDNPIIFANPAFSAMTGYANAEAIGRNCRFLQGPQTNRETVDAIRDALADERPYRGLLLNYRKDGSSFWNELRMSPLLENGRIVNWVGLLDDVSLRVEAEEESRRLVLELAGRVKELTAVHAVARLLQNDKIRLDQMLHQVVALVPTGFQLPDALGARLLWNGLEYSTPGFTFDQCSPDHTHERPFQLSDKSGGSLQVCYTAAPPLAQVFTIEERAMLDSMIEMLRSRLEQDLAARALHKANEELETRVAHRTRELEMRTQELKSSEERLRRINREILELSQLKVPQHADLPKLLQAFTEAATRSMDVERAAVWLYDGENTHLRCVDIFDVFTGEHSSGTINKVADYPLIFNALQKERVLTIDDTSQDERVADFYQARLKPLGVASLLWAPILQGGEMVGVFSFSRMETPRPWSLEDQTYAGSLADLVALEIEAVEHRQTENSLREANAQAEAARAEAEAANAAKSEFLSRMSHELRTPLNSILGFGQLLQRDTLSPQQLERVDLIVTAGRHLLKLINEVLDITRVEARGLTLSLEPVDAGEVVLETIALMLPVANRSNVSIANEMNGEMDENNSCFVMADRQKLQQILLNLLSNAIKYNHVGGWARIWCEEAADACLRISIANTGRGIAPADLPRAFLAFERLHAGEDEIEGTGLGLAVASSLAQAMNGTLEARSTPGEETIFSLTLPRAESPQNALDSTRTASHARRGSGVLQAGTCVLYIEDNAANLKLIESVFDDQQNVRLISAIQGRMGLELAREHRPDIILLDLHLPDLDGEEVLARLKSHDQTKTIPVVVLSADATPRRIENLRALGAHEYLKKPLDIAQFLQTMSELMSAQNSSSTSA